MTWANAPELTKMVGLPQSMEYIVNRVITMKQQSSKADFSAGRIPKDLGSWKQLKKTELRKLLNYLTKAEEILCNAFDERPLLGQALVEHIEPGGDWVEGLFKLREAAEAAYHMSGTPGNAPLPDWVHRAAVYMQDVGCMRKQFVALIKELGYESGGGVVWDLHRTE